jgi:hypothetical protein
LCFSCVVAFAQITDSTATYTAIHYKGSAVMGNGEEFKGCQYNVVSVIDSFLYIQLNFAGIEVGRVLATPNNILFVNKFQRDYYDGDYSVFEKLIDMEVDFFMLQDLFNGSLAFPPEGIELSYQMDSLSYEYPFFKTLNCEYDEFSVKIDVKKVTFDKVPDVNVTIPKNYTAIDIEGLRD